MYEAVIFPPVIFGAEFVNLRVIGALSGIAGVVAVAAIAFFLSAVFVRFRDISYIWEVALQGGFYATPILYEATLLPERIRWVLYLNPLTHLIETYRDLFMYHTLPSLTSVGYLIFITLIVLFIGYAIFKKLEKGFAEEV